jgi:hypothetical protein
MDDKVSQVSYPKTVLRHRRFRKPFEARKIRSAEAEAESATPPKKFISFGAKFSTAFRLPNWRRTLDPTFQLRLSQCEKRD